LQWKTFHLAHSYPGAPRSPAKLRSKLLGEIAHGDGAKDVVVFHHGESWGYIRYMQIGDIQYIYIYYIIYIVYI
jgi:hypothetical protein